MNHSSQQSSINKWFLLLLLAGISLTFLQMILPFLIDIFIAMLLVKYFRGTFVYLKSKNYINRSFSGIITVFIGSLVLIIPIIFIAFIVSTEVLTKYSSISQDLPRIVDSVNTSIPLISRFIEDHGV